MTADDVVQALGLPDITRLNQRVPKKLLAEHGAATAADKRQIQDGVDDVLWLAALKPHLIAVPAYEDAQRQYLELAVLRLALKPGTKPGRLVELVHRAVPYPVLLLTSADAGLTLSLAHLRAAQNERDKTVLDGEVRQVALPSAGWQPAAMAALSLARQPQGNLYVLYQGWLDTAGALDIAAETGRFQASATPAQAVLRHQALQQCRELKARLAQLRAQAQKERQLARQVALNQALRDGQATLQQLLQRLDSVEP